MKQRICDSSWGRRLVCMCCAIHAVLLSERHASAEQFCFQYAVHGALSSSCAPSEVECRESAARVLREAGIDSESVTSCSVPPAVFCFRSAAPGADIPTCYSSLSTCNSSRSRAIIESAPVRFALCSRSRNAAPPQEQPSYAFLCSGSGYHDRARRLMWQCEVRSAEEIREESSAERGLYRQRNIAFCDTRPVTSSVGCWADAQTCMFAAGHGGHCRRFTAQQWFSLRAASLSNITGHQ